LKYLGRYTHRIAISNYRIVDVRDGEVVFKWKDHRDENKTKLMRVSTTEFLRRFLLHVIPKKFVRIRAYGLLRNRTKASMLRQCRLLLRSGPDGERIDEHHEQSTKELSSSVNDPALFLSWGQITRPMSKAQSYRAINGDRPAWVSGR
jgi:hypothetical protein